MHMLVLVQPRPLVYCLCNFVFFLLSDMDSQNICNAHRGELIWLTTIGSPLLHPDSAACLKFRCFLNMKLDPIFISSILTARNCDTAHLMIISKFFFGLTQQSINEGWFKYDNRITNGFFLLSPTDSKYPYGRNHERDFESREPLESLKVVGEVGKMDVSNSTSLYRMIKRKIDL